MTLLGLNTYIGVTCDKCHSGGDLISRMRVYNHTKLTDIFKCKCGNEFTYEQGIINDYCEDHFASEYNFISDIFLNGFCEITVGIVSTINLKQEVPIINKVILSPDGGGASVCVEPLIIENRKSIKVISSERTFSLNFAPVSIIKVGQRVKIGWTLYGRTKDLKIAPWRFLLIYSKEQKINKNYLLSYLSAAMALEAYINSRISKNLCDKKIDKDSIEIFIKESTMPDKLFKLVSSLFGIIWPMGVVSRNKLEEIISKRNKIAHGKLIKVDLVEANEAFKTVVTGIYELEKFK